MKILLTAFALFFSTLVSAAPLNKLVVFGDSLSDNGNLYEYLKHQLPVSPPYFDGRFTNGPVWVELLLKTYYKENSNDHLLDYAFGGAGVLEDDDDADGFFTLRREMNSYFLTHDDKADANSMYIIWIGSNNYLALPENIEEAVSDVNLGIQHALERLVDKGAKHIMVVNVPDLGKTPAARDLDAVDYLTSLSKRHNDTLAKNIQEFQTRYPDVQWLYFDINLVFDDIINFPEQHGFTNVTDTCYEESLDDDASAKSILKMVSRINKPLRKDACKGYLFFDPVHPASLAHTIMASRTRVLFDQQGIDFQ